MSTVTPRLMATMLAAAKPDLPAFCRCIIAGENRALNGIHHRMAGFCFCRRHPTSNLSCLDIDGKRGSTCDRCICQGFFSVEKIICRFYAGFV
jgi:hypothetical protein